MITFVRTCLACPEQYDAFDEDNKQVGYLRLRHSRFTVECPNVGGELVYVASIDGFDVGIFNDEERYEHLQKAAHAIGKHIGHDSVEYRVVDEWKDEDEI